MADTTKEIENLPKTSQGKNPPGISRNIPIETIIELKTKGLLDKDVAKLLDCSQQNVSGRLKEWRKEVQGLETFKKNKADVLSVIQSKILNKLSEAEIKKATAYQKVGMFSLLYDKERLERGQTVAETQPLVVFVGQSVKPPEAAPAIDISHKIVDKPVDKE